MSTAEVDITTALLVGRITVLEELVRWLSLPLGDNEPVFAGADGRATANGQPLGHAPQMHTLWHQVMGTEHEEPEVVMVWDQAGGMMSPVDTRAWVQCECCKRWNVERST